MERLSFFSIFCDVYPSETSEMRKKCRTGLDFIHQQMIGSGVPFLLKRGHFMRWRREKFLESALKKTSASPTSACQEHDGSQKMRMAFRFRVYKWPMEFNPDVADSIIKPTCILCNCLRHELMGRASQGDSFDFDNAGNVCSEELQRSKCNCASEEALHIRDTFRKYFLSAAGEVPWQYDCVCRGLYSRHTVVV